VFTKHLTGKVLSERGRGGNTAKLRQIGSELAERDAALGRLEQTISDQKHQIESLRQAVKQAEFQNGVLEQSYAKQLSEARDRAAAAEQAMADQEAQIADLEIDRKAINDKLADAQSRLDMFGTEAASIDEILDSLASPTETSVARKSNATVETPAPTNEEMLAPDVMFAGKRK